MLTSLVVENLRSFHSAFEFDLKPVTILLGRNSSGKSTITRLLPLYQQSFEQRTSAPILWNGDLVDFGSINEVRPRGRADTPISLGFSIVPDAERYFRRIHWPGGQAHVVLDGKPITYKVSLAETGDETYTRTRLLKLEILINGDRINLSFKDNGTVETCEVNSLSYTEVMLRNEGTFDLQSFFPAVRSKRTPEAIDHPSWGPVKFDAIAYEKYRLVNELCHGQTSDSTKKEVALAIPYASREAFAQRIETSNIGPSSFQANVASHSYYGSPVAERLRALALLAALPQIIANIGAAATAEFAASSYIGPMRAAGERYYRWQELAVDRVDPKGENFAMYVMSLPAQQQSRLSDILFEHFGYSLKAMRESGHASLMLSQAGSSSWFNIADVGFGFSQILPVIAQIHASSLRRPNRQKARLVQDAMSVVAPVIAVEQPELHLHPAFQAKIADLLCSSALVRQEGTPYERRPRRFVVETHSEALVNRLSELVSLGKVSQEDIAIYIFDKGDGASETQVTRATIEPNGDITNWPFGFFHY